MNFPNVGSRSFLSIEFGPSMYCKSNKDNPKAMKSRIKNAHLSFFGVCFIFGHLIRRITVMIPATPKKAPHFTIIHSSFFQLYYLYSPVFLHVLPHQSQLLPQKIYYSSVFLHFSILLDISDRTFGQNP